METKNIISKIEGLEKHPLLSELFELGIIYIKNDKPSRTSMSIVKNSLDFEIGVNQKTMKYWIEHNLRPDEDREELALIWFDYDKGVTKSKSLLFTGHHIEGFGGILKNETKSYHKSQYCQKLSKPNLDKMSTNELDDMLEKWVKYFHDFLNK